MSSLIDRERAFLFLTKRIKQSKMEQRKHFCDFGVNFTIFYMSLLSMWECELFICKITYCSFFPISRSKLRRKPFEIDIVFYFVPYSLCMHHGTSLLLSASAKFDAR